MNSILEDELEFIGKQAGPSGRDSSLRELDWS